MHETVVYIVSTTRAFVGLTLLAAGLGKIATGLGTRVTSVQAYVLVPGIISKPVARLLPWVEVLVGGAVVAGTFAPLPALAATGLFTLFGVALTGNLIRRDTSVPCGCFGDRSVKSISWWTAFRAYGLGILSIGLVLAEGTWPGRQMNLLDEISSVSLAGSTIGIYALLRLVRRLNSLPEGAAKVQVTGGG